MKRNVIILLLALCTMAAGAWERQVKGIGDVEDVKTIDVSSSRFQFEPATITVAQRDIVRLRLHSADRTHGLAIKPVKALIPKTGEAVTVSLALLLSPVGPTQLLGGWFEPLQAASPRTSASD